MELPVLSVVVVRGQRDGHVARPLANARGPPKRARTVTLERGPLVHVRSPHHQLVGRELVVVLRVRYGGVQELKDVPRGRSRRGCEYGTRLAHRLAADVLDHEPGLARSGPHVLRARADRDGAIGGPWGGDGGPALPPGGDPRGRAAALRLGLLRGRRVFLLGLRLALGLGSLGLHLLLVGGLLSPLGLLGGCLGSRGLLIGLLAPPAAGALRLGRLGLLRRLLLALGLLGLGGVGLDGGLVRLALIRLCWLASHP